MRMMALINVVENAESSEMQTGFMQSVQESEWKADCSCQNSHIK